MIRLNVSRNLRLPLVAVVKQLLLVVQQLLVRLGGELKVGPLDDGVHRARLLTEAAIDALGHVDVITRCTSRTVGAFLCLDGDSLCWADCLTQFACNASFFSTWIAPECVLAAETRTKRSLFEGVVDGGRLLEDVRQCDAQTAEKFCPEHGGCSTISDVLHLHARYSCVHEDVAVFFFTLRISRSVQCGGGQTEGAHVTRPGSGSVK